MKLKFRLHLVLLDLRTEGGNLILHFHHLPLQLEQPAVHRQRKLDLPGTV